MSIALTLLIGVFLILVGLGFIALAVLAYTRQNRQDEGRVSAQGQVISLVRRRSKKVGDTGVYCPVVTFRTTTGQEVQFESQFGSLPASHREGQVVTVLYEPADPQNAEISSVLTKWLVPTVFALLGVITLCMGSAFLLPGLIMNSVSP